jgi:5'-phosphate synthase pdxT subunit
LEPLQRFGKEHAIWGTCAGSIFLSKDAHRQQPLLGLMDIQVERNAFGRQVDSFEIDLEIPILQSVSKEKPVFHSIFIRAPLIEKVGKEVEILAKLPNGKIVAARQDHLLATSFHPELTEDTRFHQYFLEVVQ